MYEYRCPSCGKTNIRNQNMQRLACDGCGHEWDVTAEAVAPACPHPWPWWLTVAPPYPEPYWL